MNQFRRGALLMLILLLGAGVAVACTDQDRALTPIETPVPPSAPTLDVETVINSVVRESLGPIPTATPTPAPDIGSRVLKVIGVADETILRTADNVVQGMSVTYAVSYEGYESQRS